MASTTTIRVSRDTRDSLLAQARARSISVTALVAELTRQSERAEMFRQERELWQAESGEPANRAELADWDDAALDGLD